MGTGGGWCRSVEGMHRGDSGKRRNPPHPAQEGLLSLKEADLGIGQERGW